MASTTIDRAVQLIRARLKDVEAEHGRLEQSLAALNGVIGPGRGTRTRSAKPRAARGQRREEVVAHLKNTSRARPTEIAAALGISGNQVNGVLAKLRKDGAVRKFRGGTYGLTAGGRSG